MTGLLEKIGLDKKKKPSAKQATLQASLAGRASLRKETKSPSKAVSQKDSKKEARSEKKGRKIKTGKAHLALLGIFDTEKASLGATLGKYYFKVNQRSKKREIARAIQEYYGVDVVKVNIMKCFAKKVRRGLISGKRSSYKKAIVTLKEGQAIDLK